MGNNSPGSCPGESPTVFTGSFGTVTVTCFYSGAFGSTQTTDTILQFQITNGSSAVVPSAELKFINGATFTDVTDDGIVLCGNGTDASSLFFDNPEAPCTAQSTALNVTASFSQGPKGDLLINFQNFSEADSANANDPLHMPAGLTLYFDVPAVNGQPFCTSFVGDNCVPDPKNFATVEVVSIPAGVPEPSSAALFGAGFTALLGLTVRRRCRANRAL